jgi:DNA-binding NtrC family response regulator
VADAPARRILVVDDEPHVAKLVRAILGPGVLVESAASAEDALGRLEDAPFDVVLCDVGLPGQDGVELVRKSRRRDPDTPFVMFTAQPTVETAVRAMREGAFDYLRKTASADELRASIERAAAHGQLTREVRRLRSEVERVRGVQGVVGDAPAMKAVLALVERVAPSDASVLILGESGTGKELLARTIHRLSPRHDQPFVAFDCSALAPSLLESELFGHERGAFTGAQRARRGLFREAQGGTLLLDEIGDIAPEVQNKLLRVLQEREIKPVGGDSAVKIDVRILAATNKDLKALVGRGAFREDLYYRLAVVPITVPALRERLADLPLLCAHILAKRRGLGPSGGPNRVSPAGLAKLAAYPWPGNIRELENVLARAAILCPGEEIGPEDIPLQVNAAPAAGPGGPSPPAEIDGAAVRGKSLRDIVDGATRAVERAALLDALAQSGGSPSKAARLLGISRASIYNKMKEYGITP